MKLPVSFALPRPSFRNPFDRHDLVIFGGLAMLGYGVAAISRPWAWIVVGALLFALGVFGLTRFSRPPKAE